VIDRAVGFLSDKRLLRGPWQAFERDIARLLIASGFRDVRLVAGTGDHGGDVIGVKGGERWVFQCKHTTLSSPPREAVSEAVEAARFYSAQRIAVATSRPPGESVKSEQTRYKRMGLTVQIAEPYILLELMSRAPEFPPFGRQLRPYQETVAEKFRGALLDTGRAQIVMATGLGKTIVMAETVTELLNDGHIKNDRVLVLAHTKELVDQLHRAFWFQLPKWVPTHQLSDGEKPTYWDGITFATIHSVKPRTGVLPEFGLVLVDEAHHIGAPIFRDSIEALAPDMLGGVTATPWRGDRFALDQILGPPVVQMGIAEGLQQGFLSDVDYRLLGDNLDWNFVQSESRHRYSLAQLNRKLIIPTRDEEAVRMIRHVFDQERRKSGIVYSPTIEHAAHFAGMLRRHGFRAESISSLTPPRERDRLMSSFRAGDLDVVATVDLFNEGVDVPDVDLIIFMRATHSRRIFVQQLGRGLRLAPGKEKVVILDFVTDLRRVAEVLQLDAAVRGGDIERLGLGSRLVQFTDHTAGDFLREWLLDQASLFLREDEATLELPRFEYPEPPSPGGVQ
jgi:superfamily II DNA or RNA helicase